MGAGGGGRGGIDGAKLEGLGDARRLPGSEPNSDGVKAGIGRPWNRGAGRAGENQSRMFSGRWGNALNSWAGVTGFVAVR